MANRKPLVVSTGRIVELTSSDNLDVVGSIIVVGNVDGRDVSVDGGNLDDHLSSLNEHRVIDDGSILITDLFSANRILAGLSEKIDTTHTINGISNGTGLLKNNGAGVWTYDSNTYLTSETSHADVLVDADIGVNIQAYDATILVDADIGVNIQAYDSTILVDADIGVNIQSYNASTTIQGNVFNGISQLVQLDASGNLPAIDGSALTGIDGLPTQTGNTGKYLTTDGTDASWDLVDGLPDQTGNSGLFLTTDGTDASWDTLSQAPTPTTSGVTSGVESSDIEITISNYSASYSYFVSVGGGSYSRNAAVITWTLPAVTVDTSYDLTIYATDGSGATSASKIHSVEVLETPTWNDDYIDVTDFEAVEGTGTTGVSYV